MKIGQREFDTTKHCYIMGILNVTPDSFSDGGKWNEEKQALLHVEEMLKQGMDIVDIGGESTRPGYTRISDEEEISRVVPVIEAVKKHFDVPISLDTYKSRVAQAGIDAGADLINDIWGLKADPMMAEVISRAQVSCCLMHNRDNVNYTSFMENVLEDLRECLSLAKKAGISDDQIILDPGVGFAKNLEQNLEVIRELDQLGDLGYPVLLGCSRKSVIGLSLDLPSNQRVEGTIATSVMGVMKGAAFVRVHDVLENARAVKMTEAILGRN